MRIRRTLLSLCVVAVLAAGAAFSQNRQDEGERTWPQPIPSGTRNPDSQDATEMGTEAAPEAFVWDRSAAAHLMRRAGFSASLDEIDRMVEQGLEASIDELVDFEAVDDSEMESALQALDYSFLRFNNNGARRPNTGNMRRWWMFRMVHSQRQLVEKMTLFWHDHFATSVNTVRQVNPDDVPLVMVQNELFRTYALGNFKEMVHDMARDPAMLIWLDNRTNVKGNPNENWARELLELFTMGEGKYTEEDIREAARAFTGWSINRRTFAFQFNPPQHDIDNKTFLGITGNLNGDDIIDIVFDQSITAEFITGKIWKFLVNSDPSPEVVADLGNLFRESGYELKPLLRAILSHREFWSTRAYRSLIKSPVEFVIGHFREVEGTDSSNLFRILPAMGQELFAPPDVGGWTSGVGWINTTTVLERYNYVNLLVTQRGARSLLDLAAIIEKNQLSGSQSVADYFLAALLQDDVSDDTAMLMEEYLRMEDSGQLGDFDISDPQTVDEKVRGLIYLVSILPAYQLN